MPHQMFLMGFEMIDLLETIFYLVLNMRNFGNDFRCHRNKLGLSSFVQFLQIKLQRLLQKFNEQLLQNCPTKLNLIKVAHGTLLHVAITPKLLGTRANILRKFFAYLLNTKDILNICVFVVASIQPYFVSPLQPYFENYI